MKWRHSDLYKVKTNFNIETFSLRNLIYNYQPLLGPEPTSLYLFLFSESTNGITTSLFLSQDRISKITTLSKEEIILAIAKLELFSLLEILYNSQENRIIYILKEPIEIDYMKQDFLKDYLINKVGEENIKINETFLSSKNRNRFNAGFVSQSKTVLEITNQKIKSTKPTKFELNIEVDLTPLINLFNHKNINYHPWFKEEIKKQITESIVIYDLTFFDVFFIIEALILENVEINVVNYYHFLKSKKVNNNLWIEVILKDKNQNSKKINLIRGLSPEEFINLRLKRPIKKFEEELILRLKNNYNLSKDIINILLDFSILKNNEFIVENYILKIADTIKKLEIIDSVELVDFLRKTQSKSSKNNKYYHYESDNTLEFSINSLENEKETNEFVIPKEISNTNHEIEELNSIDKELEDFLKVFVDEKIL